MNIGFPAISCPKNRQSRCASINSSIYAGLAAVVHGVMNRFCGKLAGAVFNAANNIRYQALADALGLSVV